MNRLLKLVTALLFVFVASPTFAAEGDWRLEKDADGVQVYTRAVEGQKIREIRAVTRIPARLSAVVAVLDDISATSQLSDVVGEVEILQRQTPTRYQVYSVLKMPWPLDDRDMVNQRDIQQDATTLAVTITNVAVPEAAPLKAGRVRILQSRQNWTLTPEADGRVLAELRALTDPAGPIPASAINAMSVGSPFKSMQQLRTMAQSGKYRQANLPFVREPAR